MKDDVYLNLSNVEAEILLIWAKAASHTTYTHRPTRRAMQGFLVRLMEAIKRSNPDVTIEGFGDFS